MSKPRIGVNCDLTTAAGPEAAKLNWNYASCVARAGGIPVLLAPVANADIAALLDAVDGLVLTGGRDYDPATYGEAKHPKTRLVDPRRDAFDRALARAAIARGIPTLGICGGAQLINIALGGKLIQHIPDTYGTQVSHQREGVEERFHGVEVQAPSLLASIVGEGRLEVNTSHHQAADPDHLGEGLRIVARSPDGVAEAIEGTGAGFLLGVQWHPERLPDRPRHMALFRALVGAAEARRA